VIDHPDPAVIRDPTLHCCRFSHRIRDCHFHDGADDNDR
jgi:hypothetical protein